MAEDFKDKMIEEINKNHDFEGQTIGEDITMRQIVDACLTASINASRRSKTFKKAKDKFMG